MRVRWAYNFCYIFACSCNQYMGDNLHAHTDTPTLNNSRLVDDSVSKSKCFACVVGISFWSNNEIMLSVVLLCCGVALCVAWKLYPTEIIIIVDNEFNARSKNRIRKRVKKDKNTRAHRAHIHTVWITSLILAIWFPLYVYHERKSTISATATVVL